MKLSAVLRPDTWPAWSVFFSATLALGVWIFEANSNADTGALFFGALPLFLVFLKIASWRPWAQGWPKLLWRQTGAFALAALGIGLSIVSGPDLHFQPMLLFLGGGFFALGACLAVGAPTPEASKLQRLGWRAAALIFPLLLAPFLEFLRTWVRKRFGLPLSNSMHLFLMPRVGYEGLPGDLLVDGDSLLWPLAWGLILAGLGTACWRRPSSVKLMMLALWGAAGKFCYAAVSSSGLALLPQKVAAISTNYWQIAHNLPVPDFWQFICRFNAIQHTLTTHGVSHPFGPELVYYSISALFGPSCWTAALVIIFLTAATPLLLAALAREFGAGPRAALAVAALYLSSPAALILSTSGIDSTISLVFWGSALLAVRSARRDETWSAGLAGIGLFFGSLLTFSVSFLALGLVLGAGMAALSGTPKKPLLKAALSIGGVCLLGHAALWVATSGGFNYLESYRTAAPYAHFGGARPSYLWAWLNPLLFLAFAGAGTQALAFAGLGSWTLNGIRPPRYAVPALALLGSAWFMALGYGECQRIFHWGYAALCLLAVGSPLADWDAEGPHWGRGILLGILVLGNALTSLWLMMSVMDYW